MNDIMCPFEREEEEEEEEEEELESKTAKPD